MKRQTKSKKKGLPVSAENIFFYWWNDSIMKKILIENQIELHFAILISNKCNQNENKDKSIPTKAYWWWYWIFDNPQTGNNFIM